MINELKEFKSYITSPTSDTPRLQPKMLMGDFGSTGNLYGLEHLLTIIARGFIFGGFIDVNKLSDDGIISDDFIATVANILFCCKVVNMINPEKNNYLEIYNIFFKNYDKFINKN